MTIFPVIIAVIALCVVMLLIEAALANDSGGLAGNKLQGVPDPLGTKVKEFREMATEMLAGQDSSDPSVTMKMVEAAKMIAYEVEQVEAKKSGIPNPLLDLKTGKCLENCENNTGYFDFAYMEPKKKE